MHAGWIDEPARMDFFSPKNKAPKIKLVLGTSPQHVLLLPGLYVGEGQQPKLKLLGSRSAI